MNSLPIKKGDKLIIYLLTSIPLISLVAQESHIFPITDFIVYYVAVVSFLVLPFKKQLSEPRQEKSFVKISSFVLLFFVLFVIMNGRVPYISYLVNYLFFFIFFTLKTKYKNLILHYFVKTVAVLFLLGLIEFALAIVGIHFFWAEFLRGSVTYYQGIFVSIPAYYDWGFARFMSVCEEPGVVGTLCVFLIAILDPKIYKKEIIVFFIAGITSLSLAFYVLIAIWMLLSARQGKMKEIFVLMIVFVILAFFMGDYLQDRIVDRVMSKSVDQIDNRASDEVNAKLASLSETEFLFGVGHVKYREWTDNNDSNSTGIKDFIIGYGIIGFLLSFFAISLSVTRSKGYNKQTLIILILYWISFYQRSYWFYIPLTVLLCSPYIYMPLQKEIKSKAKSSAL